MPVVPKFYQVSNTAKVPHVSMFHDSDTVTKTVFRESSFRTVIKWRQIKPLF